MARKKRARKRARNETVTISHRMPELFRVARRKARAQNRSFSAYIVGLVQRDLKRRVKRGKVLALTAITAASQMMDPETSESIEHPRPAPPHKIHSSGKR